MYFYEMFVSYKITSNIDTNYYPSDIDIPVYVLNTPNTDSETSYNDGFIVDTEENRRRRTYTRRFFLFDNLSVSNTIIYARRITLRTRLQNDNHNSRIYQPFIEISYAKKTTNEQATNLQTLERLRKTYVSFRTDYYLDIQERIMKGVISTFIIVTVASIIFTITRMYVWTKLNPSVLSPDNYLIWALGTFLSKLFKYWGLFMFFWIWGLTGYFYLFFKIQYRPYVMFPTIDVNYKKYHNQLDDKFYETYILYMLHNQVPK